jgi:hypothetical protein
MENQKSKIKVKVKTFKVKFFFWGQGDATLWGAVISPPVTPPF